MYQWVASGLRDDSTISTRPALKPKPAIQCMLAAMNTEIPVSTAWITYSTGATNMKENSSGSVIPVKKAAKAAASMMPATLALFSGRAQW
ncbi:Uncharacterised protein [Acinetobacter baumannii]|nr:Uncharacterised protein [Acinetobacter baumannii]